MADWMNLMVAGSIHQDGRISAEILDIKKGDGKKPGSSDLIEGYDESSFDKIRNRVPNTSFSTRCSIGVATAVTTNIMSLETLSVEQLRRLQERFGHFGNDVLLQTVRNTGAPGGPLLRNVFEPTGGGAQIENLELAQLMELAGEMGIYHPTRGWARLYSCAG